MTMRDAYFRIRLIVLTPFLKLRNSTVGRSAYLERGVFLSNSKIGNYSYIGHNSIVSNTEIGNYCCIAAFCQIGGMEHSHWWISMSPRLSPYGRCNRTIIGHDVWIGSKVTLREGIRIGNGSAIGSNSVVLKDVEPYTIVAGSPARVIRHRFSDDQCIKIERSQYFNLPPSLAKKVLTRVEKEILPRDDIHI